MSCDPVQPVAAPLRTSGGAGSSDHPVGSSAARSTGGGVSSGGGGWTSAWNASQVNSAAATNTAEATRAATTRRRGAGGQSLARSETSGVVALPRTSRQWSLPIIRSASANRSFSSSIAVLQEQLSQTSTSPVDVDT